MRMASQSYRSASMGFSTAAFLAGRYPKAMPMPAETPKATRIAAMLGLTVMGVSGMTLAMTTVAAADRPKPRAIPSTPVSYTHLTLPTIA